MAAETPEETVARLTPKIQSNQHLTDAEWDAFIKASQEIEAARAMFGQNSAPERAPAGSQDPVYGGGNRYAPSDSAAFSRGGFQATPYQSESPYASPDLWVGEDSSVPNDGMFPVIRSKNYTQDEQERRRFLGQFSTDPIGASATESYGLYDDAVRGIDDYASWAPGAYDSVAAEDARWRAESLGREGWLNANLYNPLDQQSLDNLRGAYGRSDAADAATLGGLQSLYGSIRPVQFGNVTLAPDSRAAQAYADPQSIAQQNAFLSQLQGVAGGSLDGVSQAAQAYADPATIAGQQRALGQYGNMAAGGWDLASLAAEAGADPESIEAQKYALGKYKGWSDPTVTAEERFIMELARRNEEQDRRAAMEAFLRDLEARGVRGSGAEMGAFLGAQQTTSQNRMLQDLGAEANAVQRAERALAGYTGLANTIRGQSFTEDFNTRSAADAMNVANRGVRVHGVDQAAALNTTMRGQSFEEAFNRGAAADNMYNANANRQVAGMQAGGQLATNMRGQSFEEAFNRGQAADALAQFNTNQQNIWNRDAAYFGLQQNNDIWGRGNDLANTQLAATRNSDVRASNLFDADTYTTNKRYERDQNYYDRERQDIDAGTRLGIGGIGLRGDIAFGVPEAKQSAFSPLIQLAGMKEGKLAADNAAAAAEKERKRWKGVLGLDWHIGGTDQAIL